MREEFCTHLLAQHDESVWFARPGQRLLGHECGGVDHVKVLLCSFYRLFNALVRVSSKVENLVRFKLLLILLAVKTKNLLTLLITALVQYLD